MRNAANARIKEKIFGESQRLPSKRRTLEVFIIKRSYLAALFVIIMTYSKRLIILVRELTVVERSLNDRGKIVFPGPFDTSTGSA